MKKDNYKKITELYVFVAENKEEGEEGIVSTKIGDNHLPLVTSKIENADIIKNKMKEDGNMMNKTIKLIKLTNREEIETIFQEDNNKTEIH